MTKKIKKIRLVFLVLTLLAGSWGACSIQSYARDQLFKRPPVHFFTTHHNGSAQKPFSMRYQYRGGEYFQPEQTDPYYPLTEEKFATWSEYCQSFKKYDISKVCFIGEDLLKIREFLEHNKNVRHLNLVDPLLGTKSIVDLDFLNDFPNVTSLRLCFLDDLNYSSQVINLSGLQSIIKFCHDSAIVDPGQVIYPPYIRSVITDPTKISMLPPGIVELTLEKPRRNKAFSKSDLNRVEQFQLLEELNVVDLELDTNDIFFLKNLPLLASLYLHDIKESDANALVHIKSLQHLKAWRYHPSDFTKLSGLSLITFNALGARQLLTLHGLSSMSELESLSLWGACDLNNLSLLQYNQKLKKLSLSWANSISSLRGLETLPLEDLEITFSQIESLEILRTLGKLKYLDLSGNYPLSWEGIRNHPCLERIQISGYILSYICDYCDQYNFPSNPLDALKTIPHLKLIDAQLGQIKNPKIKDFQLARPDVIIEEYGDWKNVVLEKE